MEKKKSVSDVTNEKVSTYISDDIAFSVLSKLPLKSFKRFESVRKSWSLLSENHHFMNMFRNNFLSNSHSCSYDEGASLLLFVTERLKEVLYSFSGKRFENKMKLDFSNPFKKYDFHIFGSVNGTLCLYQFNCHNDHDQIVLCNPTTQTIKLLPLYDDESSQVKDFLNVSVVRSCLHGFGYDHVENDYYVIRHVEVYMDEPSCQYFNIEYMKSFWFGHINLGPKWEIYSLRSNSWRELHVDIPSSAQCTEGTQVYMDGACHWLCEEHKEYNPAGPCLVSFYLSNEVSFITPIPQHVTTKWINLVVLNGSIALISYHKKTTTFRISILGKLGSEKSWIELFMVGPLPCIERPIGVGAKGEIFFVRKNKEVAWFDLSTQMIEELGYKAENLPCRIINYKESILSFEE